MKTTFISILLLSVIACQPQQQKTESTATKQANSKKPKNIILMIGDGMGVSQIYAGLTANGNQLNLERIKHIGFHKTYSKDNYITDSAAGATAFSCGKKTYNGAIGVVDQNGDTIPLKTILESAEERGLATGLVATSSITHATPASFIAHQPSRYLAEDIAADFLNTDIDVFIGGGKNYFSQRADGRNLLDSLKARGYEVLDTEEEIKSYAGNKLAGFIAEVSPDSITGGRSDILQHASSKAIEILNSNENGYFLMIEGSQIDWGGHSNNTEYITTEMIDFDRAIGQVLDYAEKDGNTLVIVTADHETGGFAINGGSFEEKNVDGAFTTLNHTGVMVPVFAYGPGADYFMGIYENTAIYDKMMELLNLN